MKLTFTRAAALLALAIGLTACGGKASFTVGGPVTGLIYDGLVITNVTNGDTKAVPKPLAAAAGATTFALDKSLDYGQTYDVRISAQPEHETCTLFGGADTAGRLSVINITVTCAVQQFTIGGTVSGLRSVLDTTTKTGLVITNGADKLALELDGAYVMPAKVAYAQSYGVSIVTQPTGKTCTVSNPSDTVKSVQLSVGVLNPVDNINISCVANP